MEVHNECRVEHSHRVIVDFEDGTGPVVDVAWGDKKISVQRLAADADPNTGVVAKYVDIKRGVYMKQDGTPGQRTTGPYYRTAFYDLPANVQQAIRHRAEEIRHEVTV